MLIWLGLAEAMLGEAGDDVGAGGAIELVKRRSHEARNPVPAQYRVLHC